MIKQLSVRAESTKRAVELFSSLGKQGIAPVLQNGKTIIHTINSTILTWKTEKCFLVFELVCAKKSQPAAEKLLF